MVQNQLKLLRKNILLCLLALLFFTGIVSGQESGNSGDTQLKVIQLSPDAGSVDIFIDGEQIGDDLSFGELAGTGLESGVHVVRAESENINLSRTVDLQQGRAYTLTINNRAFEPGTTLIPHNTATSNGQTKLRMAHFSPDLLTVNAELENGGSFTTNLDYLETGNYTPLSPGNYTVEVEEQRIGGTSFNRQIRLRPNTTYTAFIAGLKSGSSEHRLRIIPVTGRIERQIDNGGGENENGNGDTDNGDTGDDEEDTIRQDFSLVCRFEENSN